MMGLTQRRPDDRIEFANTICRPIAIRPWLAAGSAPGNPRTMRQNGTGPVRATKPISGAGAGLEVFSNHLPFRLREPGSLPADCGFLRGPYRWPFYYKKRANVEFRLPSVRAFGSPVRAGPLAANQALQHFAAEAVETTAIDGKYGKDRTPKCGDRKVLGE